MRWHLKRVYDEPAADDGMRVLVDRLWPRGVKKAAAEVDLWAKDVAPSADLRRAFHGGELDFDAFADAYRAELAATQQDLDELREACAGHEVVTLVYGARDEERNHAVVLRDVLARHG